MIVRIGCVVEGHGEVESVPILIRRVAQVFDPAIAVAVPHPIRVTKSKLLKAEELERAVRLAALKVGSNGGILVVIDSDDDCPAELGPALLRRVRSSQEHLPCALVLAKKEFEAWFLASAESLRGCRGLPMDLDPPTAPEEVAGAKEWLASRIPHGAYASTVDQPALTAAMDIALARRSPSFDKCYREISALLDALRSGSAL